MRGAPGAQGPPGFCEFCNYPAANYVQYTRGNEKDLKVWFTFNNHEKRKL
jgi:hypothetical protein